LLRAANVDFNRGKVRDARRQLRKKRASLKRKRRSLPRAMPSFTRHRVERDLDSQLAALDDADAGFAAPPPVAGAAPRPAQKSRRGKVQIRRNESAAHDLGL
jgi:hypothetical protein